MATLPGGDLGGVLPARAPAPTDAEALDRFIDWLTLCEVLNDFSPVALDTLGFGTDQEDLLRDFVAAVSVSLDRATEPVRRALDGIIRVMPELSPIVHIVADRIRHRTLGREGSVDEPVSPWEEDRTHRAAESTVRRVLADL